MQISKYNIQLIRVQEKHLEIIRTNRNKSFIQEKMLYRKTISPQQQINWFKKINTPNHYYFIIKYQNRFVGLVNGKDINFTKRTSEGGIFIWEKELWDTHIPSLASIIMTDLTFLLNNFKINYAKILKDNTNALQYNKSIGYKIVDSYPSDENSFWLQLLKEDYLKKMLYIRKGIGTLTVDKLPLQTKEISFEDISEKDYLKLYAPLPNDIKKWVDNRLK